MSFVTETLLSGVDILKALGNYGINKITNSAEAELIKTGIKAITGVDVDTDNETADVIKEQIEPLILDALSKTIAGLSETATKAIDDMDEIYSKETFFTMYPNLNIMPKIVFWLMVLTTIGVDGYLLYDFITADYYDKIDLAIVVGLPLTILVVLSVWPIKTLAAATVQVGGELLSAKIKAGDFTIGKRSKNSTILGGITSAVISSLSKKKK